MRKLFVTILLLLTSTIMLGACSASESSFSIQFIDVGQGDATLVECDGHHMLIDGGDTFAGEKVYNLLKEQGIQHLDILAISHTHKDHIGGLVKALTYATTIDKTISNTADDKGDYYKKVERQIVKNGSTISVPSVGDKYNLGSAEVEVVDASTADKNDSLVLLVTYRDTRYMFTGDIGNDTQRCIADRYFNETDEPFKIDIMKMPHHGGEVNYYFIRTFKPDFSIISVGEGNQYGHPSDRTLELITQSGAKVYRTDKDGDITVKSNGKQITIESSR